jgi:glycosyltransferase involved in cell wall biosynthesis
MMAALRKVVAEVRPGLIHLNGLKPALVAVAVERRIPHLITAHHGGICCPAGALLRPDDSMCDKPMDAQWCVACYCAQLKGGSVLGRALGHLPAWVYRPAGRTLNVLPNATYIGRTLMYPWLVEQSIEGKRSMLAGGQLFVAPSKAIEAALVRNGVSADRIALVPHGINPLSRVPLANPVGRPLRFGYVGQIQRAKGLKVLFEAFATLPPGAAHLTIVGQPQRPGEAEYLARAMRPCQGRQDVVLRGAVAHEEIGRVMAEMDVVVLPSIFLEVFGLVVLEAFSVGRPVIVTDSGGPSETVRHGIDGLVVPPNDAASLAAAMSLLVAEPQRVADMAAAIRPVRTLQQHVDDLERLYQRVIAEPFPQQTLAASPP